MSQTIYRTYPRLIIFSTTLLGAVFCGLLALLLWSSSADNLSISKCVLFASFLLPSIALFYYFITIRIVKVTDKNLVIQYLVLPFKQSYTFSEVVRIYQNTQDVEALVGDSWKKTYLYTHLKTIIELADQRKITINSIGSLDFEGLVACFKKIKRGEGKYKQQNKRIILYLIDNIGGLIWAILLFLVTIGLGYGLLT